MEQLIVFPPNLLIPPNKSAYLFESIQEQNSSNSHTERENNSITIEQTSTPLTSQILALNTLVQEIHRNREAIQRLEIAIDKVVRTLSKSRSYKDQGVEAKLDCTLKQQEEQTDEKKTLNGKKEQINQEEKDCTPIQKAHKVVKQSNLNSYINPITPQQCPQSQQIFQLDELKISRKLQFDVVSNISQIFDSDSITSNPRICQPKVTPPLQPSRPKNRIPRKPAPQGLSTSLFLAVFIFQLFILSVVYLISFI